MAEKRKLENKNISEKWLLDLMKKAGCDSDLWDVLSALRGPDVRSNDADLKWLSTARLRAIVNVPAKSLVDINPVSLNQEQIENRNKLLSNPDMSHFRVHFKCAMRTLKNMGYDIPDAEMACI